MIDKAVYIKARRALDTAISAMHDVYMSSPCDLNCRNCRFEKACNAIGDDLKTLHRMATKLDELFSTS